MYKQLNVTFCWHSWQTDLGWLSLWQTHHNSTLLSQNKLSLCDFSPLLTAPDWSETVQYIKASHRLPVYKFIPVVFNLARNWARPQRLTDRTVFTIHKMTHRCRPHALLNRHLNTAVFRGLYAVFPLRQSFPVTTGRFVSEGIHCSDRSARVIGSWTEGEARECYVIDCRPHWHELGVVMYANCNQICFQTVDKMLCFDKCHRKLWLGSITLSLLKTDHSRLCTGPVWNADMPACFALL